MKFVQELKENPEKKEVIEKYEKFFEPISGDVQDQAWYKEYVATFPAFGYLVPDELAKDFDRELLMQLVASSFSSDGLLEVVEGKDKPDFVISVQSGDQVVVKKVSELRGFQVLRLYEIYCEEQMNLQVLIAEDENEKKAILAQRESREHRWKLVMDNMEGNKMKKVVEEEKEEKLGDLYDQL
ncbi:MAG: hypothetical protein Q8O99_07645 [bacterium]|nr:hypothetical protein [bacterium]